MNPVFVLRKLVSPTGCTIWTGPYALGSFLRLTEVKSDHDWCHCLDMPETRVLCRVQEHQCKSTRRLFPWKSGTRSTRLASSQPESKNQCGESSACTFLLWVQRVTSCSAVVESSDPTKPPLQLGHPAQRCQHLCLANPGGCRCRLRPPYR